MNRSTTCCVAPPAVLAECSQAAESDVLHGYQLKLVPLQKLVKQGAAGLSKAQYQLMYVQSGLVHIEDKHNWDVMTAVETY